MRERPTWVATVRTSWLAKASGGDCLVLARVRRVAGGASGGAFEAAGFQAGGADAGWASIARSRSRSNADSRSIIWS